MPLAGDRLFLSKGYGTGSSLLAIRENATGKLAAEPLWNPPIKRVMKTKFCNVVMRDGYVYGLDDVLLSCIELETGKLKWKKRRDPPFGHGQIMLIGDVILVLSETGELALVEASPERYRELASLQALDRRNVTWNNPAYSRAVSARAQRPRSGVLSVADEVGAIAQVPAPQANESADCP